MSEVRCACCSQHALVADLEQTLSAIIEAAGEVRMWEGRSCRKLWRLLDEATDRWFLDRDEAS